MLAMRVNHLKHHMEFIVSKREKLGKTDVVGANLVFALLWG